jgi:hypothetical protein
MLGAGITINRYYRAFNQLLTRVFAIIFARIKVKGVYYFPSVEGIKSFSETEILP